MPMRIRPVQHPRETSFEGVSPRHRFADKRGFGQDLCLPRIRLERFPLFDTQWLEHGVEESIALVDRLALNHFIEPLPVTHSALGHTAPLLALWRDDLRRRRISSLRVRIGTELRE